MPGPKLQERFTYDGSPTVKAPGISPDIRLNVLRFYDSKDTGTHSKIPKKVNIPQNSNKGQGVNSDKAVRSGGQ